MECPGIHQCSVHIKHYKIITAHLFPFPKQEKRSRLSSWTVGISFSYLSVNTVTSKLLLSPRYLAKEYSMGFPKALHPTVLKYKIGFPFSYSASPHHRK